MGKSTIKPKEETKDETTTTQENGVKAKKTRVTQPVPEGHVRKVFTLTDEQMTFIRNVRRETSITPNELIQIALNVIISNPAEYLSEAIAKATSVKLLRMKPKTE